MGTRHLICVVKDGDYKVAQYGQWDGYPDGQGCTVLKFLKDMMDREIFESRLAEVSWITEEEAKAQWTECGADDSGLVGMDVANLHSNNYPENSRDTGADILEIIQNADRPIKLVNQIDFANDSLFCEWAYVIDLDKNVLEVYKGFNKEPLQEDERFSSPDEDKDGEYCPIKLAQTFALDALPSEDDFIELLDPDEDDE